MALTEQQRNRVWEKMTAAQKRAIYFGSLANRRARTNRFLVKGAFVLSSGALLAIGGDVSKWVAFVFAAAAVVVLGYLHPCSVDDSAAQAARLHYRWNELAAEYERLWNHWYEDAAEELYLAAGVDVQADGLDFELKACGRVAAAIEAVRKSQAEHEERKRKISEEIANGARISRK